MPFPMPRHMLAFSALAAAMLSACSGEPVEDREAPDFEEAAAAPDMPSADDVLSGGIDLPAAAGAEAGAGNSAGASAAIPPGGVLVVEGRVIAGTECPAIETVDGTVYALGGERIYEEGARLRVEGELARASFCVQGEGTLVPITVRELGEGEELDDAAPLRRSLLTPARLTGRWIARGGDCEDPAFVIAPRENGALAIETQIRGEPVTGSIDLGPAPSIRLDNGTVTAAITPAGASGLVITPPAGGTMELGREMVLGTGREFEKCRA